MSDSLALNKAMASVLVCGIVFMVAGLASEALVRAPRLEKTAIKIDVQAAAPVASTDGGEAPLPAIAPLLAKADPAAGEKEMQKVCSVCHTWTEGGPAKVGPNLYGILGAIHGHMAGFNYSDGLKAIKGPWTYDELNAWLRNPRDVVPGTRMSFAGIDNDKTRADVIDYLHTLAASPQPLPPVTAEAAKPATTGAATATADAAKPATTGAATAAPANAAPAPAATAPGAPANTVGATQGAAGATTSTNTPQAGAPGGNPAGH